MQVSHDEHHRKEQHNSSEMDEIQGVVWPHGTRGEHENGPDDGSARSIDLHSRKFPKRDYDLAGNEN